MTDLFGVAERVERQRAPLLGERSLSLRIVGTARPQNTGKIVRAGAFSRVVPDKSTEQWKALIRAELSRTMHESGQEMMTGAVYVTVTFHFQRPKSHFGTGKNERTLKPDAPDLHTSTPDADRLATAVLDALKGALFHEDCQVSDLVARKRYVKPGAPPSCELTVHEVR